jgi:predicted DsbA family dithiol-disulfide isomerase
LKQEFDISIKWRAFPLHPEVPEKGVSLKQYFAGKIGNIDKMIHWMKQTALDLGLPFGEVVNICNSRLAQEMGAWAESENRGTAFHHAAFNAYFVKAENLADQKVLEDIVVSIGLDGKKACEVLEQRTFKNAVDADWKLAVENAVTAVPTFMINGERLVGAQPYDKLKRLMHLHNINTIE